MRLRFFPPSLTGEATNYLKELPNDSVDSIELKEEFLSDSMMNHL